MKSLFPGLGIYVALTLLVLFSGCKAATDKFVEANLKTQAAAANEMANKEVADGVRLDSVSAEGKSMRFSYTMLEYSKGDLDIPVFYKNAKAELIKEANTNPDLKFFREHKVKIAYAYYFADGEPLSTIVIKPEDYK